MCRENLNCLLTEKCTNEMEIRADERAKVLDEVLDAFSNNWTLDSLACHENKYEIFAIIRRQIEQLKERK